MAGHLPAALAEAEGLLAAAGPGVPYQEPYFQAGTCAMLADRLRTAVAVGSAAGVASDLERAERLAVQFLVRAKSAAGPAVWAKLVPGLLADRAVRAVGGADRR